MKTPLKALCFTLFFSTLLVSVYAQTGIIVRDIATGVVDGTTTPISYGSTDDTWVVKPPETILTHTPYVCTNFSTGWDINSCGRWITPYINSILPSGMSPAGNYSYFTGFTLDNLCFPWAKITFNYLGADDNIIGLYVNGHPYTLNPSSPNDYTSLVQNVTINLNLSDLQLGANTLSVQVNNSSSSYTGFFACGNVSVGFCPFFASNTTSFAPQELLKPEKSFQTFPNPSSGRFSLELKNPAEGVVSILDLTGREIKSFNLSKATAVYSIDLSASPKGIYSISVRTGEEIETQKIVLQ